MGVRDKGKRDACPRELVRDTLRQLPDIARKCIRELFDLWGSCDLATLADEVPCDLATLADKVPFEDTCELAASALMTASEIYALCQTPDALLDPIEDVVEEVVAETMVDLSYKPEGYSFQDFVLEFHAHLQHDSQGELNRDVIYDLRQRHEFYIALVVLLGRGEIENTFVAQRMVRSHGLMVSRKKLAGYMKLHQYSKLTTAPPSGFAQGRPTTTTISEDQGEDIHQTCAYFAAWSDSSHKC